MREMTQGGAKSKTKGALTGAKESVQGALSGLTGRDKDDDDEDSQPERRESRSAPATRRAPQRG